MLTPSADEQKGSVHPECAGLSEVLPACGSCTSSGIPPVHKPLLFYIRTPHPSARSGGNTPLGRPDLERLVQSGGAQLTQNRKPLNAPGNGLDMSSQTNQKPMAVQEEKI